MAHLVGFGAVCGSGGRVKNWRMRQLSVSKYQEVRLILEEVEVGEPAGLGPQ